MASSKKINHRYDASLDDRKLIIIENMFIAPADADYVSARWSFSNGMFHNFYWNASQAIEKYCKAAMLLNNHPAKNPTHDVKKLYEIVANIDSEAILPTIIDLRDVVGIGKDWWQGKEISVFLDHISIYGSPDNRYGHAGTYITSALIVILDDICASLRKLIRVKNFIAEDLFLHNQRKTLFHEKIDRPLPWMINHDLMLEKLHRRLVDVGQKKGLRKVFLQSNRSFSAGNRITSNIFTGLHSTFFPLLNQIIRLKYIDKSQQNTRTINALERWVQENIYISGQMKKDIEKYKLIAAKRDWRDI